VTGSPAFTLGDILRRNLALRRDAPAILFEGRTLTHGDFAARAFRLARALRRLGVQPKDRVAILAQNCPEYLETYAAGELGGWITVPINYRLAAPEVAYILADSRPKILIVEAPYLPLVSDAARAGLGHVLTIGGDGPDLGYEPALAQEEAEPVARIAAPDDIAWLIYTSGTTGRPKGVMLSHGGQVWAAQISALEMGVRPTDRAAVAMPLYHVGARNTCVTRSLQGCPIILHRAYRTEPFLASLAAHGVTETLLAPTMLKDLLEIEPDLRRAVPSLARIFYSAAPMPEALLRRALAALGPIFAQVYGMTESGGPGCMLHQHQHRLDGPPEVVRRLRSAGQPMVGCDVRILRPDGGECGVGELGEIVIGSAGLMLGYWNNPAATSETLRDGALHTGDIGERDEAGFITVVDRIKDMIVSGGENIYSREVEEALLSHPAISEAAVVGAPDERWGERVVAFLVRRPGAEASEEAITDHCRRTIAAYKRPKQLHFVESLPKLPNGKVEKFKLREPLWAGRARSL
jgi:acyl-CoA synthetase (AMP-forming)/AMP-acid ligase II